MEEERAVYTIPPLQIMRLCMLMPVYYKIYRNVAGINTYQASILFTLMQVDTHNVGMYAKTISLHNPMSYETIRNNIKTLFEMGYIAKDEARGNKQRIYLTVAGLSACERIISRLNSYRGETIQAVELTGTWIERKKERKQKAINKLANNPHMIKAALQVIEAKKGDNPDNLTMDKILS
jgi:DNA-binding MarR family transcriptional regulator